MVATKRDFPKECLKRASAWMGVRSNPDRVYYKMKLPADGFLILPTLNIYSSFIDANPPRCSRPCGFQPCPLWVKSRHVQRKKPCPLYPRKRPQMRHMESTGQRRTLIGSPLSLP